MSLSWTESSRIRRAESRDFSVPSDGPEKTARIDLGLALLSVYAMPGVCYSYDEIAGWCGCTESAIFLIEKRAIKKLCNALRFRNRDLWDDLRIAFFDRQTAAVPNERWAA